MTELHIGAELVQRGWTQGSLFSAASAQMAFLARSAPKERPFPEDPASGASRSGVWELRQAALNSGDSLVIVSHDCDIARTADLEPYVEALRAYWAIDKDELHHARTNSFRRLLLRRRVNEAGVVEGLVIDATVRLQIEKAALLTLTPTHCFEASDRDGPRRFRRWLGERYSRQPLPDHLVAAVQRPIVDAIRKLGKTDDRRRILEGVREMLFVLQGEEKPPYQVEFWFLANEGEEVAPPTDLEGAAKLAGWIAAVLERRGDALLVSWELFDTRTLTVHDYIHAYELPLDVYTLTEDAGRLP